jgi:hypothetical protein
LSIRGLTNVEPAPVRLTAAPVELEATVADPAAGPADEAALVVELPDDPGAVLELVEVPASRSQPVRSARTVASSRDAIPFMGTPWCRTD